MFTGQQGGFDGLDQVNLRLPRSLMAAGQVEIAVNLDGWDCQQGDGQHPLTGLLTGASGKSFCRAVPVARVRRRGRSGSAIRRPVPDFHLWRTGGSPAVTAG